VHAVQQRHGVSVGLGGGWVVGTEVGGVCGQSGKRQPPTLLLAPQMPERQRVAADVRDGHLLARGLSRVSCLPAGTRLPAALGRWGRREREREGEREREAGSAFGLTGCAFDPFPAHHTRTHGLLCWLLCRQPQLHDLHGMVCRQPRSALNPPALQTISRSVRPATRVRMRVYRLQSAVVATTRRRARSAVCSARLDPRMWTEKEGGGGISPHLQQPVGRFLHSLSSCVSGSSAAVACGSGTYSASGASACSNCPLGHECPLPSDGESELIGFSL
jgi:hypothetical protein